MIYEIRGRKEHIILIPKVDVPLILRPIARLKFSIKTSVFLISDEYTSDPTIGQKGTFDPNSCAMAKAIAVFPVPAFTISPFIRIRLVSSYTIIR